MNYRNLKSALALFAIGLMVQGCGPEKSKEEHKEEAGITLDVRQPEGLLLGSKKTTEGVKIAPNGWAQYNLQIPSAGRYSVRITGRSDSGSVWIEDYVENVDGRTYDITGNMVFLSEREGDYYSAEKHGSPLDSGTHPIRIHARTDTVFLKSVTLEAIQLHGATPSIVEQSMEGEAWKLALVG